MKAMKIVLAALAALMVLGGVGLAETAATTVSGTIGASISVSAPASVTWNLGQSNTDNQKTIDTNVLANDATALKTWNLKSYADRQDLFCSAISEPLDSKLQITGGAISIAEDIGLSGSQNTILATSASPTLAAGTTTQITLHQATTTADKPGTYTATITFVAGYNG